MDEELKSHLTSKQAWLRLLYMVLFAIVLQVVGIVITLLVLIQFIFVLIDGRDNERLRGFGHSLSSYVAQALYYLTYNTDEKPFPFSEWPEPPETDSEVIDIEADDVVEGTGSYSEVDIGETDTGNAEDVAEEDPDKPSTPA